MTQRRALLQKRTAQLETAPAVADGLADVDVERHRLPQRASRPGSSQPAASSTAMQVTEVIRTSVVASSSWPAWTAS